MSNVEVNELISVLEEIRQAKYPDIPASLIKDIVTAQYQNQDNRTAGRTRKTHHAADAAGVLTTMMMTMMTKTMITMTI